MVMQVLKVTLSLSIAGGVVSVLRLSFSVATLFMILVRCSPRIISTGFPAHFAFANRHFVVDLGTQIAFFVFLRFGDVGI